MEELENDLKDSQDYSSGSFSKMTKIIAWSILVLFFVSFLFLSGFASEFHLGYIILICIFIVFAFFKLKKRFIRFNDIEHEQHIEERNNNKLRTTEFIKNAPKKCWAFLREQYKNPVLYLTVIVIILIVSNVVLSEQVEDLEINLRSANSDIYSLQSQMSDLEKKIEEIEDGLSRVESVAHRHYYY